MSETGKLLEQSVVDLKYAGTNRPERKVEVREFRLKKLSLVYIWNTLAHDPGNWGRGGGKEVGPSGIGSKQENLGCWLTGVLFYSSFDLWEVDPTGFSENYNIFFNFQKDTKVLDVLALPIF